MILGNDVLDESAATVATVGIAAVLAAFWIGYYAIHKNEKKDGWLRAALSLLHRMPRDRDQASPVIGISLIIRNSRISPVSSMAQESHG